MPIKKAQAKNFQSLKNVSIDFSKEMNVLFGFSDNGKSAFIRFLKLMITNRPNGTKYISHWSDEFIGLIKVNNKVIKRVKSQKENYYKLNKKEYSVLKTFPEDIYEAMNLSSVNIQSQDETYFLVDISPGKVSKKLNEVAGLSVMDDVMRHTNKELKEFTKLTNETNRKVVQIEQELYDLEWAEKADEELHIIEVLNEKISKLENSISEVKSIINEFEKLRIESKSFLPDEFLAELNSIILLRNRISKDVKKIELSSKKIETLQKLEKEKACIVVINVNELEKLSISVSNDEYSIASARSYISDYESLKIEHIEVCAEEKKARSSFTKKLKELGKCPLCSSVIK